MLRPELLGTSDVPRNLSTRSHQQRPQHIQILNLGPCPAPNQKNRCHLHKPLAKQPSSIFTSPKKPLTSLWLSCCKPIDCYPCSSQLIFYTDRSNVPMMVTQSRNIQNMSAIFKVLEVRELYTAGEMSLMQLAHTSQKLEYVSLKAPSLTRSFIAEAI